MREKCNVFLLCIMLSFTAIAANATQVWDGTSAKWTKGSGTEKDPYLIETPNQLAFLAEMVSAGISDYSGKYFKQTQDFDMKSLVFTPIGIFPATPFKGNYNGNNKFVSNLNVSGDNNNKHIALFCCAIGATISNLTTKGSFASTSLSSEGAAGILAYGKDVTLINCTNMMEININSVAAAGIVAFPSGTCTLKKCSNSGKIYATSYSGSVSAGGIVGYNYGTCTIIECLNTNIVSATIQITGSGYQQVPGSYSGGIVGYNSSSCTLVQCSNVGSICSSSIFRSFGTVYRRAIAGGIIGFNYIASCTLTQCASTGSITAPSNGSNDSDIFYGTGGLIGYSSNKYQINNCYARGTQKANATYGIAGGGDGIITNSYFAGKLEGVSENYGVAKKGSIVNSYFNSDCGASTSSEYGTSKTTAQLKSISMPILLNGSETGSTWVMDTNNSNDGYSILGWQVPVAIYKITATCDESQGSVSGGGNYTEGTIITLTATPKEGYIFSGWSDGDKTNPRSVTVGTTDATYTALFVKMRYVITVNQDCSVNIQ